MTKYTAIKNVYLETIEHIRCAKVDRCPAMSNHHDRGEWPLKTSAKRRLARCACLILLRRVLQMGTRRYAYPLVLASILWPVVAEGESTGNMTGIFHGLMNRTHNNSNITKLCKETTCYLSFKNIQLLTLTMSYQNLVASMFRILQL